MGLGHRLRKQGGPVLKGEGVHAKDRHDRPRRARGGGTRKPKPQSPYPTPLPDMPGPLGATEGETPEVGGAAKGGWIKGAIKRPGALHRALHVPAGEKIPAKKLAKAAHSKNERVRHEATLAKTLKGFHH
jgi:hypothetical protein